MPPSARKRKQDQAREHLLRATWACMDVAEELTKRRQAQALTAAERAELARMVDAAGLASRARARLDELDEPTRELPGQTRIGE